MNFKTKMILLGAAVIVALIFFFVGTRMKPVTPDNTSVYEKMEANYKRLLTEKTKVIDSLELDHSRMYVSLELLRKRYVVLEKKKNKVIYEYREKVPEKRAVAFLEGTNEYDKEPVPTFINDSLLVGMINIDNAMVQIIEKRYVDSVLYTKLKELSITQDQVQTLETIVTKEREKSTTYQEMGELTKLRLDASQDAIDKLNKKLKWAKIKGTVKDVVIVAGVIFIVVL